MFPLWLLPCSRVCIQCPACYSCGVCSTSAWAAFPAAPCRVHAALQQLWFSSALLLSLLSCLSTFQAQLHSGLKHYLLLCLTSAGTSSQQRMAALKLFPNWAGGWSWDPSGISAHWQVQIGMEQKLLTRIIYKSKNRNQTPLILEKSWNVPVSDCCTPRETSEMSLAY